jgi:hypothetical protein
VVLHLPKHLPKKVEQKVVRHQQRKKSPLLLLRSRNKSYHFILERTQISSRTSTVVMYSQEKISWTLEALLSTLLWMRWERISM